MKLTISGLVSGIGASCCFNFISLPEHKKAQGIKKIKRIEKIRKGIGAAESVENYTHPVSRLCSYGTSNLTDLSTNFSSATSPLDKEGIVRIFT